MWFRRRERIVSSLALAAMLAYALVPSGLLAACGCGSCECAEEVAGQGCCCTQIAQKAVGSCCVEKIAKPSASCSQQACSAGISCVCDATDMSQPGRIAGPSKVLHDGFDSVPLPGALLPLVHGDAISASRVSSPLLLATPVPLHVLLCVWRN